MQTHDTFVLGIKNDRIIFIKTFDYEAEKEAVELALNHVQDKSLYDSWNISHVGQWILEHKNDAPVRHTISIPMP